MKDHSWVPDDNSIQTIEEYLNYLDEKKIGTMTIIGAAITALSLIDMAHRTYQDYFGKYSKLCSGLLADEKKICILTAKARSQKMEIDKLKELYNKCDKSRKPSKCKNKLVEKINQIVYLYNKNVRRIRELRKR